MRGGIRWLTSEGDSCGDEPGEFGDISGRHRRRWHHPRSADGAHGRKLQVVANVARVDSAGRNESHLRERGSECGDRRGPAESGGGKELDRAEPEFECGLDLGRSDRSWKHVDAELEAAFHNRCAEPGRHHELSAGGDRLVNLCSGQDGAGTDEDVATSRDRTDGIGSVRRQVPE